MGGITWAGGVCFFCLSVSPLCSNVTTRKNRFKKGAGLEDRIGVNGLVLRLAKLKSSANPS